MTVLLVTQYQVHLLQLFATLTKLLLQVTIVARVENISQSFQMGILFGNSQKLTVHENIIFQMFVAIKGRSPI